MPKLTDAIARVYERFGQPSQDVLPFSRAVDATRACYERLETQMRLSDVEWNLRSVEFQLPGQDQLRFPVPASDYGFASKIEYAPASNGVGAGTVEIVAFQNLHHYRRQGMQAASIVGRDVQGKPEIEFAMYSSHKFRLFYEPDVDLYPDIDEQLEIRATFIDYLATLACRRLLPFVQLPNVSLELLKGSLDEDEFRLKKDWEIWVHKQPGKGSAKIRPANVVSATQRSRRHLWRF